VPVCFGLELAIRSRRAWISIINECHIVPYEYAFFDCDALADKGVARDFATRPDSCAFLDFNESANFRFIANLASVKVYKSADLNIVSEFYVGRYKLISHFFFQSRDDDSCRRHYPAVLGLRCAFPSPSLSRCHSIKDTSKVGPSTFLFLLLLMLVGAGVLKYERENE